MRLSRQAARDRRPFLTKTAAAFWDWFSKPWVSFKYDFYRKHQRQIRGFMEEVDNEWEMFKGRLLSPSAQAHPQSAQPRGQQGQGAHGPFGLDGRFAAAQVELSLAPLQGRPHPDLSQQRFLRLSGSLGSGPFFAEFAGVCSHCGYHFPMEPEWYVKNVFDPGSVFEFNSEIEAGNPLDFPGFAERISDAQKKTGAKSGCMTFEARIDNTKMVVAMLMGTFRGGSVGAAEGYKFVEAAQRAAKKRYPFLAYVHGTAGIRIQEGTHGVIQMPRCTVAVRRYIESGGLYMVLYDTNSFAGPVASFLGCSPYQFAVRSSNIGFAGPGVIKETTGMDIPPKYHRSYRALSRGHIQGIWDRRQIRANLKQALLTIGGRNLYYR